MHVRPANLLVLLIACTTAACSSLVNTDDYTFVAARQDGGKDAGSVDEKPRDAAVKPDGARPDAGCSDDDRDGVCKRDDACPGSDDGLDADGDHVPDGCDVCAGFDDALDEDADQVPDGCDCDQSGDVCNADASCTDGSDGVECACNPGFGGDGKTACVFGDCNPLDPPVDGEIDAPTMHEGDVATFSCHDGFALIGATRSTCKAGSKWSNAAPSCRVVSCDPLGDPDHGKVAMPDGTDYQDVASYSCDDGYTLTGDAERTCTDVASWSGDDPTCEPVDCGALTAPDHGDVTTPDGTTYEAVGTYTCDAAYTLTSAATRTCQSDASWSGSAPGCGPDCKLPDETADSAINNYTSCSIDPYGGACLGECGAAGGSDDGANSADTRACLCNIGTYDERPAIVETFTKPATYVHGVWTYKYGLANAMGAMCAANEITASCFNGTSFQVFSSDNVPGLRTVSVLMPDACMLPSTQVRVEMHQQNCQTDCSGGDHYVMYYDGKVDWLLDSDAESSSTNDFASNVGCSTDPLGAACLGGCNPQNAVDESFDTRACLCDTGMFDYHPSITETFANPSGHTVASWTYKFDIANTANCAAAEITASCFNGASFIPFHSEKNPGMKTVTVPLPKACVRAQTQIQVQQHLKDCPFPGDCMNGDHYVMYYEGKVDWDNCL